MTEPEELLPAMTREEKVLDTVGTVTSMVPLLGAPVSAILLGLSGDRRFDRVRACLVELAERIGDLDEDQQSFFRSEDFEDLLVETTQRVWAERSETKRRVYRDFLLDAIANPTAELYDERLRFLRVIEQVQEAHIEVLRAILQAPNPNTTTTMGSRSTTQLSRLGWGDAYSPRARLADLLQQLRDIRIVEASGFTGMVTGAGSEDTRSLVTQFGQRFTRYLEADE
jgi:hypothetical protein